MVRRIAVVVAMFAAGLAGVPLLAQDLSVAYVQGDVSRQNNGGWTGLTIGETIPSGVAVKLGDRSYVEITGRGGVDIVLSQPGTYPVSSLVSAAAVMNVADIRPALSNVLTALFTKPAQSGTATLGLRGADESQTQGTDWVSSDADVYLQAGKEFMRSGNYTGAITQFSQALDGADGADAREARYDLASAYSLSGNERQAAAALEGLSPTGSDAWAPDFVLLKARLLLDSYAFQDEVQWLKANAGGLPDDAIRAPIYDALLGLGYRGLRDVGNEQRYLSLVVQIAPSGALGQMAASLLKNP